MNKQLTLNTLENIAEAQSDLDQFVKQLESGSIVTVNMLPWGLIVGKRQEIITEALAELKAKSVASG